jgi:hypothetical protein
VGRLGGLTSALDGLRGEPLDGDVVSSQDNVSLLVARARLEGELLRRLRVWDTHSRWAADGALSATAWLAHQGGLRASTARGLLSLAHRLANAPLTAAGLGAGVLTPDQACLLAHASSSPCTAAFQAAEGWLIDQARRLSVEQLGVLVQRWRERAEAQASLDADVDAGFAGRHLHASITFDGTVAVDGELDPDTGAVVVTALNAAMEADRDVPGEPARPRPQRRADALGVICRHYLDTAALPRGGGERPHLGVIVDLAGLTGPGPGHCVTDSGVAVSAGTVRQWACDAGVHPIFTRGPQEILSLGRRTRIISPALRRALTVRDRHCRFPGCDRPASWCDVHHLRHWLHGGRTDLPNLMLLCRRHHRLLHHGWTITGTAIDPVFTRPDGMVLSAIRAGPAP